MPRRKTEFTDSVTDETPLDLRQATASDPYADVPIEVYERRLLDPDSGTGSEPIQLRIPGTWYCRWINTTSNGRWSTVVHRLGYVPVRVSDLADPKTITGLVASPDGVVTRGDRGQEVLVRMPQAHYDQIKWRQAERLVSKHQSVSAQKEAIQQGLAKEYGPEAAEAAGKWRATLLEDAERFSEPEGR